MATQTLQRYFRSTLGGGRNNWTLDQQLVEGAATRRFRGGLTGRGGEVLGIEMVCGAIRSAMNIALVLQARGAATVRKRAATSFGGRAERRGGGSRSASGCWRWSPASC